MAVNLGTYLRFHPVLDQVLDQLYPPQVGRTPANPQRVSPSTADARLPAPGRPSDRKVWVVVDGQPQPWPARLVADLREALGQASDGVPRDPNSFSDLPGILSKMSLAAVQTAIDVNAWAKQEGLQGAQNTPEANEALNDRIWTIVSTTVRACAPLSESEIASLMVHLCDAEQPQKFHEIAARLHASAPAAATPVAAPRQAPLRPTNAARPVNAAPRPQMMARPSNKVHDLASSLAKNVTAAENFQTPPDRPQPFSFQAALPIAEALACTDRDVLTNAVVLELIARRVPRGHGTLQELTTLSNWELREALPQIARTLNLPPKLVEQAVQDLRKFIRFNRMPVQGPLTEWNVKRANALIIDQYLGTANSRQFDRGIIRDALRDLPHPEQLIGIGMLRPDLPSPSSQMHRNAAHPGRVRPNLIVDASTRKRHCKKLLTQLDAMAA